MYANQPDQSCLPQREIYNRTTSPGIFPVKYNLVAERREGRRGGRGDGKRGKKLNMKGKMIWRRRRGKVDI